MKLAAYAKALLTQTTDTHTKNTKQSLHITSFVPHPKSPTLFQIPPDARHMSIDLEISVQFDTFPGKQNYKKFGKLWGIRKGLGAPAPATAQVVYALYVLCVHPSLWMLYTTSQSCYSESNSAVAHLTNQMHSQASQSAQILTISRAPVSVFHPADVCMDCTACTRRRTSFTEPHGPRGQISCGP